MRKLVNDLTGKTFGRLHVIGVADDGKRKTSYICQCECGNIRKVRADALMEGRTKSCGCLKKEQDGINLTAFHSHMQSGTRLYEIWQGIKNVAIIQITRDMIDMAVEELRFVKNGFMTSVLFTNGPTRMDIVMI